MPRTPRLLALGLIAVGCRGATDPVVDPAACRQTYEFGNTGCGDLAGVVTDRAGRPLPGAYVSAAAADGRRVALVAGPVRTDTAGRYLLRATRMLGAPPAAGPDTLTAWVRAGVPPPAGSPVGTRGAVDSAAALVTFAPVGARPPVGAGPALSLAAP